MELELVVDAVIKERALRLAEPLFAARMETGAARRFSWASWFRSPRPVSAAVAAGQPSCL